MHAGQSAPSRARRENRIPVEERLAVDMQTAADLLSCSRRHLYDLIAEQRITSVKIGRLRMITRAELKRFLAELGGSAA